MGLFSSKNNTISDAKMRDLQRRARKADRDEWLGKKAIAKRERDQKQRRKSAWS